MSFYKYLGQVYFYEKDQEVPDGCVLMTNEEIDRHLNPEKYLSEDERLALIRQRMPDLTPIEFDLRLRKAGLLQTVRDYVASNEVMEIAYTRATYFRRTDPFIETARQALELTNEQVDTIWMNEI